jgi:hypothetical protein
MSGLGLGLGLGLGTNRIVDRYGNIPAVFTVTAGDGTKYVRVQVSETTTVTPAGGTSIRIGGSGEFVTTPLTLAANTDQDIYFKDAGSFTIPRRKLVTSLLLSNMGSSAITGDITGMKLTYLYLDRMGSSVITGNITGMKLTRLVLNGIGSSVITGDITGMPLTTLLLQNIGSSFITGDITGMGLTTLYLNNIGSSLTYGTNLLNITHNNGIQLLGNTVFSANEYIQLFADAATCVTDGKWTASTKVMTISGGENPGWSNVEGYYDIIVNGGVLVKVPLAWESGEDPFPSATPNS